jgi:hypothetical protein
MLDHRVNLSLLQPGETLVEPAALINVLHNLTKSRRVLGSVKVDAIGRKSICQNVWRQIAGHWSQVAGHSGSQEFWNSVWKAPNWSKKT